VRTFPRPSLTWRRGRPSTPRSNVSGPSRPRGGLVLDIPILPPSASDTKISSSSMGVGLASPREHPTTVVAVHCCRADASANARAGTGARAVLALAQGAHGPAPGLSLELRDEVQSGRGSEVSAQDSGHAVDDGRAGVCAVEAVETGFDLPGDGPLQPCLPGSAWHAQPRSSTRGDRTIWPPDSPPHHLPAAGFARLRRQE